MELKKWFIFLCCDLLTIMPITIMATNKTISYVNASREIYRNPRYTCASIKLGLDETTMKAKTYAWQQVGQNFYNNPYYRFDNTNLLNCLPNYCYFTNEDDRAIRVGLTDQQGQIYLVFDRQVIYTTIYLYTTSRTTIKVNGDERTVYKGSEKLPAYTEKLITYTPMEFELEPSDTITIQAKNVYIADITFRVM